MESYAGIAGWLNENQGVLGVAIFVVSLAFGWLSGIFSALRRRPKFRIELIEGPTFVCTFQTGKKHGEFDVHRTGVVLYLKIANVGSAPSSIERISVAYHWHVIPFTRAWLRYRIGWFWLHDQTAAIHDFQTMIGDNMKVYPFLTQKSILISSQANTYLEPGQLENGVVYFEQPDSWGGCFPSVGPHGVKIKVSVRDVFGSKHTARFIVPSLSLEEARRYNPSFGKTLAELHKEPLPQDVAERASNKPMHATCETHARDGLR